MSEASNGTPPWRHEVWRLMHGPADAREARWFLARMNDGDSFWSITEPGTPHFVAAAATPETGVAWMAAIPAAINPVIEKMDPGSPDDLRAEINYLRSREAHFASVFKVADGGQYRNDWTAPLQRVLDENKALHAEVDALRRMRDDASVEAALREASLRALSEERARQRDEARADLDRVRLAYARGEGHEDLARELAAFRAQHEPLVACVDALRAAALDAGWLDALATGEHLVAWVRRGALREALALARAEPGVPDGATQADFNAVECARRIADGIEKLMGGE